ncbi:hypothetical protein ScPMuIL_014615 [Solemya velum]
MDVPQHHHLGADPKAFLEAVRSIIHQELVKEILDLNRVKYQLQKTNLMVAQSNQILCSVQTGACSTWWSQEQTLLMYSYSNMSDEDRDIDIESDEDDDDGSIGTAASFVGSNDFYDPVQFSKYLFLVVTQDFHSIPSICRLGLGPDTRLTRY